MNNVGNAVTRHRMESHDDMGESVFTCGDGDMLVHISGKWESQSPATGSAFAKSIGIANKVVVLGDNNIIAPELIAPNKNTNFATWENKKEVVTKQEMYKLISDLYLSGGGMGASLQVTSTGSQSPVKLKEFTVIVPGTYTLSAQAWTNSNTSYGQIYVQKNGVNLLAPNFYVHSNPQVPKNYDFQIPCLAGDKISIHGAVGNGYIVYVQNAFLFRNSLVTTNL